MDFIDYVALTDQPQHYIHIFLCLAYDVQQNACVFSRKLFCALCTCYNITHAHWHPLIWLHTYVRTYAHSCVRILCLNFCATLRTFTRRHLGSFLAKTWHWSQFLSSASLTSTNGSRPRATRVRAILLCSRTWRGTGDMDTAGDYWYILAYVRICGCSMQSEVATSYICFFSSLKGLVPDCPRCSVSSVPWGVSPSTRM